MNSSLFFLFLSFTLVCSRSFFAPLQPLVSLGKGSQESLVKNVEEKKITGLELNSTTTSRSIFNNRTNRFSFVNRVKQNQVNLTKQAFVENLTTSFTSLPKRFYFGFKNLGLNINEYAQIRIIPKSNWSFTQHELVKQTQIDLRKVCTQVLYAAIAKKYYPLYYVFIPSLFSSPDAWKHYPSTFTFEHEKEKISELEKQKKMKFFLEELLKFDDHDDSSTIANKFQSCLNHGNMKDSLNEIKSWIETLPAKSKSLRLNKQYFPARVVRKICNEFGLPNIPIMRSINMVFLNSFIRSIKEEDDIIKDKVRDLSKKELTSLCQKRCIFVLNEKLQDESYLRKKLNNWLKFSQDSEDDEIVSSDKLVVNSQESEDDRIFSNDPVINSQNKRFAMMTINLARSCRHSSISKSFKAINKIENI